MNRWAAIVSAVVAAAGSLVGLGVVDLSTPAGANPSGASPGVFVGGGSSSAGPYDQFNLSSLSAGGATPTASGSFGAQIGAIAINSTATKVVYGVAPIPGALPSIRVEDVATRSVASVATGFSPVGLAADPTDPARAYAVENTGNVGRVDVVGIGGSPTDAVLGTTGRVTSPMTIAASPDGSRLIVSGGANQPVLVSILVANPGLTTSWFYTGHSGTIPDIAIAPAGNALYGVTSDGSVFALPLPLSAAATPIWSRQVTVAGSVAQLSAVAVTPDGSTVYVTGSGFTAAGAPASTVQAFSASTGTPGPSQPVQIAIGDGNDGPVSEAVSPDGSTLLVAGTDFNTNQAMVDSFGLPALSPLGTNAISNFGSLAGPQELAITPDQAPVAAFSSAVGAAGSASTFNAGGSSVAYGSVNQFHWTFGDGQSQTTAVQTTSHTYAVAGNYTVTLVETDSAGTSVPPSVGGTFFSVNGPGQTPFKRADVSATVTHQISVPPPGTTPTTLPAGTPTLVLNPALGPPGTLVTVTGSGFPHNTPITITWSVSSGSVVITSDASGNLPATILPVLVPDVLGPRFAVASSTPAAQAPFLVVPGSAEPGGSQGSYLFRTEGP